MHEHGAASAPALGADLPRILLVGNSNVGKSVLFRLLTGRYVIVSNYPGTTVEIARGTGRLAGRQVEVIDTPGANSLSPNSEDERIARDVVLKPGERVVVQVADAKNIRRALLLTAQLAELEIPTVLALNMWDEAQDRGIQIDVDRLAEALGVPVVPTVATERRGLSRLTGYLNLSRTRPPAFRPTYTPAIEDAVDQLVPLLPDGAAGGRGLALMLLAGDPPLEAELAREAGGGFADSVSAIRTRLAGRVAGSVGLAIQRARAEQTDALLAEAVTQVRSEGRVRGIWRLIFFFIVAPALFYAVGWRAASLFLYGPGSGAPTIPALGWIGTALVVHGVGVVSLLLFSLSIWRREYRTGGSPAAALGRLSTHPVGGFALLLLVLWLIYRTVGVFGAGDCVDFLEGTVFGTLDEASGQYGGLVNGPLSRRLAGLVGSENPLCRLLFAGLGTSSNLPVPVDPDNVVYDFFFAEQSGLISTGLTYAIAIVFPIVTLFFLCFALMEDSGYLPRLALLLDRAFKRMGLSGKAALPMVLGLGCGTMAVMTTRILETRRQRLIAMFLLALAVPCSAQLGIITAVLAAIAPAGVLIYVVVVLLMVFGAGWGAAKILPGERADFLLEVPPFRWPSITNALVKTYHRVKWFMREAVPLFLLGTACLFVAERVGLLRYIEAGARPLVTGLLGLPARATIGFILGFLRRDYGAVIIFKQFDEGHMGADQALVALVVITLFVPCLAHLFVCIKELGLRRALLMDLLIFAQAFLIGGAVRALIALTGVRIAA